MVYFFPRLLLTSVFNLVSVISCVKFVDHIIMFILDIPGVSITIVIFNGVSRINCVTLKISLRLFTEYIKYTSFEFNTDLFLTLLQLLGNK